MRRPAVGLAQGWQGLGPQVRGMLPLWPRALGSGRVTTKLPQREQAGLSHLGVEALWLGGPVHADHSASSKRPPT